MRSLFRGGRLEREMQEEMEAHLRDATDRLVARGLTPDEARLAARREFGNVAHLQEEARDARGARWIDTTLADLRFGIRHFGRTPLTTVTMIALLALGIGIDSAIFTFLHSLTTLPPPGVAPNDALVRIRGTEQPLTGGRPVGREISHPELLEYAAQRNLFASAAGWSRAEVLLEYDAERAGAGEAVYVTGDYFKVLGVRPVIGAGLPQTPDNSAATSLVAVIGDALWEHQFNRAPDVLGRTIKVNGVTVTIVGVASPRFAGAWNGDVKMRVWLPLGARAQAERSGHTALLSYDSTFLYTVARGSGRRPPRPGTSA